MNIPDNMQALFTDYLRVSTLLSDARQDIDDGELQMQKLRRKLKRQKKQELDAASPDDDMLYREIETLKTSLYNLRSKRDRHETHLTGVIRRMQNTHFEHTRGHVSKISGKGKRMQVVIKIDGTSYTRHLHRNAEGEWWGNSILPVNLQVRYHVAQADAVQRWDDALREAQKSLDIQSTRLPENTL